MPTAISSIILKIKNNIFNSINFLRIRFIDRFRWCFKRHIRKINPQSFISLIRRQCLHISRNFLHIFNLPWRILLILIPINIMILRLILIIIVDMIIIRMYATFRRCKFSILRLEIWLTISIVIMTIFITPSTMTI